MQEAEARASRRDFLMRWAGGTLLASGGSVFGAMAARQIYAELSVRDLRKLNAGLGRSLYPARARSSRVPASAHTGAEPPIFVASVPAAPASNAATKPLSITIPAIDLQSDCVELGTQMVDGQLVWKTPDHAVGHHVGTAMPGEVGNSVFSGHISSPLSHEGNVFHRLPELANKLGSDVQIVMEGGRRVRYQVVGSQVVTPSDIWVMGATPTPILTMLTCVPDGIYTYRLVVSGTLIS